MPDDGDRATSRDFEVRLLIAIIHNSRFRDYAMKSLTDDIFTFFDTKIIFDEVKSLYSQKKSIGFFAVYEKIRRNLALADDRASIILKILEPYLDEGFDRRTLDAITEGVISFVEEEARERLTQEAILKSSELHSDGKYEAITDLWHKITTQMVYKPSTKTSLWETIDHYDGDLRAAIGYEVGIPTGIIGKSKVGGMASLDNQFFFKGVGRGQIIIFHGDAGVGKTTLMWNMALYQSYLGFNVAYYSMEVPTTYLMFRTMSAYLNVKTDDIIEERNSKRIKMARAEMQEKYPQMLDIDLHDFAHQPLSISTIRYNMMMSAREGKPIDALYIDYLDLLQNEKQYKEKRFEIGQNAIDFRILTNEFNCAGFSPSQMSKKTFIEKTKKMMKDRTSMAEDYSKVRTTDILVSMNEDEVEASDTKGNITRTKYLSLLLDKNRFGKEGLQLIIYPNKDTGRYFDFLPKGG
jgi:replicative DNA helicase